MQNPLISPYQTNNDHDHDRPSNDTMIIARATSVSMNLAVTWKVRKKKQSVDVAQKRNVFSN